MRSTSMPHFALALFLSPHSEMKTPENTNLQILAAEALIRWLVEDNDC